jgi:hypothetical protein
VDVPGQDPLVALAPAAQVELRPVVTARLNHPSGALRGISGSAD